MISATHMARGDEVESLRLVLVSAFRSVGGLGRSDDRQREAGYSRERADFQEADDVGSGSGGMFGVDGVLRIRLWKTSGLRNRGYPGFLTVGRTADRKSLPEQRKPALKF